MIARSANDVGSIPTRITIKRVSQGILDEMKRPDSVDIIRSVHERGLVRYDGFKRKTHTVENKKKFSALGKANVGPKNSQYGRFWITNGIDNAKCSSINDIPNGWFKGRTTRS